MSAKSSSPKVHVFGSKQALLGCGHVLLGPHEVACDPGRPFVGPPIAHRDLKPENVMVVYHSLVLRVGSAWVPQWVCATCGETTSPWKA